MFIETSGVELFDQNADKACGKVRTQMFIDISGIDLFDQNTGKTCG